MGGTFCPLSGRCFAAHTLQREAKDFKAGKLDRSGLEAVFRNCSTYTHPSAIQARDRVEDLVRKSGDNK